MKNHFSTVSKLVAAAICALSLGSCSRAEYAMLPKGGSYHGVVRAATPVPATAPVAVAPLATTEAPASAPIAPVTPATAAAPVAAPVVTDVATTVATRIASAPAAVATPPPAKLNLVQRLALQKVTRKMDKLVQKSGAVRSHDNTASVAKGGISGNLRTGLILLLIGILIGLIPNLGLVGTIIAIIGIVFIVLWLLDQL